MPVPISEISIADGLFLSLDVSGSAESIVGYRAKKNSLPIDLTKVGALNWRDYWEPVHPERGRAHRARAGGLLPTALI